MKLREKLAPNQTDTISPQEEPLLNLSDCGYHDYVGRVFLAFNTILISTIAIVTNTYIKKWVTVQDTGHKKEMDEVMCPSYVPCPALLLISLTQHVPTGPSWHFIADQHFIARKFKKNTTKCFLFYHAYISKCQVCINMAMVLIVTCQFFFFFCNLYTSFFYVYIHSYLLKCRRTR